MDLEWFKNYYNLKCEVIKNREAKENYAFLIKKCAINSLWNNVLSRGQRIQLQFLHKTPANFNLLPPHSYLQMLYVFNTSPKLLNIPGHQVNTDQHLPFISQLRISSSDIIIWINWVLLSTTTQLSYIPNPALIKLESYSI